jgi:hypothetical protein
MPAKIEKTAEEYLQGWARDKILKSFGGNINRWLLELKVQSPELGRCTIEANVLFLDTTTIGEDREGNCSSIKGRLGLSLTVNSLLVQEEADWSKPIDLTIKNKGSDVVILAGSFYPYRFESNKGKDKTFLRLRGECSGTVVDWYGSIPDRQIMSSLEAGR